MTQLDTLRHPNPANTDQQLAANRLAELTSSVENIARRDNPHQEYEERCSFLRTEVENGNATPAEATQALYGVPNEYIDTYLKARLKDTQEDIERRGGDLSSISAEDEETLKLSVLGQNMKTTEQWFELALVPDAGDDADAAIPIGNVLKTGFKSIKNRVSLTFKETRSAFRHMVETKRAIRGTDGDDRSTALANAELAERNLKLRVAKTTGALAVTSFITEKVTSGDASTAGSLIRGAAIGAAGAGVAMGYEYATKLRERASDASLSFSTRAVNIAGKIMGTISEKAKNLSQTDNLKERQQLTEAEITNLLPQLPENIRETIENNRGRLDSFESDPNFDHTNKDYRELRASHDEILADLDQQFGKEKIKRSVKITAAVGVAAVGAAALYVNRYGFRMIDLNPFNNGSSKGSNGVTENLPTGSGNTETGTININDAIPTIDTSGGDTPSTTLADNLTPERLDIYESLSDEKKEALSDFMPTGTSPAEQDGNPANLMLDAAEKISSVHDIEIGSSEHNKIAEKTFKLAAKKEEFLGNSTGTQRQELGRQFDAQFQAWLEHMKDLNEAAEATSN